MCRRTPRTMKIQPPRSPRWTLSLRPLRPLRLFTQEEVKSNDKDDRIVDSFNSGRLSPLYNFKPYYHKTG